MKPSSVFAFCLGAVLLASCSAKQSVVLDEDGRATIKLEYVVSPAVADTMISMMSLGDEAGSASPKTLFKIDEIKSGFQNNPHIQLKSLSAPTRTSLKGEFVYDDFEQAFKTDVANSVSLVSFDRNGGLTTLKIHIAKDTIGQVAALFPEDQRAYVDLFAPPAVVGIEMTEAEYLDMLKDFFPASVVPEAKKAVIELTFTPAGKITAQKGGTLRGNSVVFAIPLLKMLVLEKPLDFSIAYQD